MPFSSRILVLAPKRYGRGAAISARLTAKAGKRHLLWHNLPVGPQLLKKLDATASVEAYVFTNKCDVPQSVELSDIDEF